MRSTASQRPPLKVNTRTLEDYLRDDHPLSLKVSDGDRAPFLFQKLPAAAMERIFPEQIAKCGIIGSGNGIQEIGNGLQSISRAVEPICMRTVGPAVLYQPPFLVHLAIAPKFPQEQVRTFRCPSCAYCCRVPLSTEISLWGNI